MPHNGFNDSASTAIVQAVVSAGLLITQATTPEWRRSAPVGANIIVHIQAVLNHIRIRPNRLMCITRQSTLTTRDSIGIIVVFTRFPRRTVAGGTSHFVEQYFAALHLRIVEITRTRHGETTMPYHKVVIVFVGHFLTIGLYKVFLVSSFVGGLVQT